jgi:alanine racemase
MNEILQVIEQRGISEVLIDSRSVVEPAHSIFFALETATGNGHRYLPQLVEQGIAAVVVQQWPDDLDPRQTCVIRVADTLAALQEAAAEYRRTALRGCMVVAVAGSRGKTIVKEWIAAALSHVAPTGRSPRSYNSQIGVALSVLAIRPTDRYAVIEAGVSRAGEMQRLRHILAPDGVVVTNVLADHAAGFESIEQKRQEKLSLAAEAKWLVEGKAESDYMKANAETAAAALAHLGVTAQSGDFRSLRPRIDVTEGVNGCVIMVDEFTCDILSTRSACDFMHRRQTPDLAGRAIIIDAPKDGDYQGLQHLAETYGLTRRIGIGFTCQLPGWKVYANAAEMLAEVSAADFVNQLILVKGEPDGEAVKVAEVLQARHHETVLEVNLDSIIHNFNHYRAMLKPSTGLVAMVKAGGYGVGSYELAKTLQSQGAAYLAVAVVDEGEELRRAGITMPIMVLNPKVTNYDSLFANDLEPEIFSFDMLAEIVREGRKRGITDYPVHIKFDTGMHRLGFELADVEQLGQVLAAQSVVKVRSIFSHLATADCLDMDEYTLAQLHLFERIDEAMSRCVPYKYLRHILNSAGIARFPQWQYDMARLGIGLYGVDTLDIAQTRDLHTVSTLRTIIIAIKEHPAGNSIGYARRTILDHPAQVATVPVGYADGLDRHLGNGGGEMWIGGVRCPIVGNICMDACMVDVTRVPNCRVGDSVEIFGENINVNEVAERLGTIPYEVLTSVSPRVKRIYYRE